MSACGCFDLPPSAIMDARYTLQNHPAFSEPLSKADLHTLVSRGSLARGEMCVNEDTGLTHTVGEIISGMRQVPASQSRLSRPAYREISPDEETPGEVEMEALEDEASEEDDDEENEEDDFNYTPSGEAILHHTHPSWLGYTMALFLALLLFIAAGLLFALHEDYALIALLCASATLIAVGIARFSHDYIVTQERVELIWGIVGRSSKEARICDIRSIDVYESGIKGLLGLGTIDFSTAANAGIEVQFKNVRRAHELKDLVRKLQRGAQVTND